MRTLMSLTSLALLSTIAFAGTTNKKAHEHGAARLTFALENETSGSIDLDVPAESIYGFEHKPSSDAERKAQDDGLSKLRDHASDIVRLPAGCTVTASEVGIEHEAAAHGSSGKGLHGEHADVTASYTFACDSSIAGAKTTVGLFALFPRIKMITFEVLSSAGQSQTKLKNGKDEVRLH